jgi:NAD(P)H-hydrate epimerase
LDIANKLKASLSSFIWVPWNEIDAYIEKSDTVLIGPGLMRYKSDKLKVTSNRLKNKNTNGNLLPVTNDLSQNMEYDEAGKLTREVTEKLLKKFPNKKWVIDAGSLQTMDSSWIPENAILTPNAKEFEILFKVKRLEGKTVKEMAEKYNCIIVAKGPETIVASPDKLVVVKGGNAGLTKGGSGDVLAGLTVALLAKNDPFLSACAASYIEKSAADDLYKKVGTNYNMDDLADKIPQTLQELII